MHSKAYIFSQTGGPEVLTWSDVELGDPTDNEVLVQHSAIGVNYIDIYHRKGVYPLPMPSGLGVEAAGIILAVGRGVTHLTVGDRVVYAGGPPGAYSDKRLLPAARVIRIPDGIEFETAASTFFKGLTAGYLITQTFRVQAGQSVLFHAAAGGVGSIAVQWLKHIGARVIAVVGSEEKSALVKTLGADDVLVNTDGDFASCVRTLVPEGVDVVYDSVGKTTFRGSVDSLKTRGMLVSFGNSSGPIPENDGSIFGSKGSLYFTKPSIAHYMATHDELVAGSTELFELMRNGSIQTDTPTTYPLSEAPIAQADLEARRTTGSIILVP